jgi:hypothetical protein
LVPRLSTASESAGEIARALDSCAARVEAAEQTLCAAHQIVHNHARVGLTDGGPVLEVHLAQVLPRLIVGLGNMLRAHQVADIALRDCANQVYAALGSVAIPSSTGSGTALEAIAGFDAAKVQGLLARIRALRPEGDVGALLKRLLAASTLELREIIERLSDAELASLGKILSGYRGWARTDLFSRLLAGLPADQLERVSDAWPWLEPVLNAESFPAFCRMRSDHGALGLDQISAGDIHQASVGDCWFLANLMAIADRDPDFIRNHIRVNDNGTVSVLLYDKKSQGHWVTVTRDLPVSPVGNPVGAYSTDHLWVSYYEKAMAVAYQDDNDQRAPGQYSVIDSDFTGQGCRSITGKDGSWLPKHDFDTVKDGLSQGKLLLVSTRDDLPRDGNLAGAHAYYARQLDGDRIRLENPWGPGSYVELSREQFNKAVDACFQVAI